MDIFQVLHVPLVINIFQKCKVKIAFQSMLNCTLLKIYKHLSFGYNF